MLCYALRNPGIYLALGHFKMTRFGSATEERLKGNTRFDRACFLPVHVHVHVVANDQLVVGVIQREAL